MRKISGILLLLLTVAIVMAFNRQLGKLPPIGKVVDPISGFWANAEDIQAKPEQALKLTGLKEGVTVWMDDHLIPHIHANNTHDLYYAQGYLHARYRLWQMDLQTRAAAGRVSEVLGVNEKVNRFDRMQRRKGMVYAAERSLQVMEADPQTREIMDAYAAGINCYIKGLSYKDYPIEYKLMDFAPELWNNLKSVLLLKYMADDLTGETDDIALSYLRDRLPPETFHQLYPERNAGSDPVIPAGTIFDKATQPIPDIPNDSVFPHYKASDFADLDPSGIGSNNWAVGPARTQSGAAMLCNDPHLALNLPSLWYEVQLQMPGMNVYGASLPGAPGVVLGFNDSVSWGFTNNYRDVKDFYALKEAPGARDEYIMNGNVMRYTLRVEKIAIRSADTLIDTVKYAIQGPVLYDANFPAPGGLKQPLAMCWMAHRATNELLAICLMNKAQNYDQFVNAIMHYQCPAQNIVYADRQGNIAIWGQGQFINKWKEQGRYIMNGSDLATLWGSDIPMHENPHALNPAQGYLASANETVTDSSYPYYYNGKFTEWRAWRINQLLKQKEKAGIKDMFAIQQDTYSLLAEHTLAIMLNDLDRSKLSSAQKVCADSLVHWNRYMDAHLTAPTLYTIWWSLYKKELWQYLKNIPDRLYPLDETTAGIMEQDNKGVMWSLMAGSTPFHEHLKNCARHSFMSAVATFDSLAANERLWYRYKNTSATHLAKLVPFSFDHLDVGGWGNTVNAAKGDHGPSWRMVVQMGKEIEAYGIYPGGQSGNPGSANYADFLNDWAAGQYYRLLFLPNADRQNESSLKYTIKMQPDK